MNPFHSLSDDQLAEWHRLTTKCDRLQLDLIESRKATESAQAAAEEERQKLRAEVTRRGDVNAELMLKQIDLTSMLRQNAAALVVTLKALRALVVALDKHDTDVRGPSVRQALAPEVQAARDALRAYDIPF